MQNHVYPHAKYTAKAVNTVHIINLLAFLLLQTIILELRFEKEVT